MDELLMAKTFVHDVDNITPPQKFPAKSKTEEKETEKPQNILEKKDGSLKIEENSTKMSEVPSSKRPSMQGKKSGGLSNAMETVEEADPEIGPNTKRIRLENTEENNKVSSTMTQNLKKNIENGKKNEHEETVVISENQLSLNKKEQQSMVPVTLNKHMAKLQKEILHLQQNQAQQYHLAQQYHQVQQLQHMQFPTQQLRNQHQLTQVHQHQQLFQQQPMKYQVGNPGRNGKGDHISQIGITQNSPTLHQLLKCLPGASDESNEGNLIPKPVLDQYKMLFQSHQNSPETQTYRSQQEQMNTKLGYYKNLDSFSNDQNRQFQNLNPSHINNKFAKTFFEENKDKIKEYGQALGILDRMDDDDRTTKPHIKASSVQELLKARHPLINNRNAPSQPMNSGAFPTIRLKKTRELMEPSVSNDTNQSEEHSSMPGRFPTVFRNCRPLDVNNGWVKAGGSCIMWVHLQASICTEWEQSSMVMKSQKPLVLQTQNLQNTLENNSTTNGPIPSDPEPSKLMKESTSQFVQEVEMLRKQQKPPGYKKPRTIHRCILKTTANGGSENENSLICHVCSSGYSNYRLYLTHLMDSTCIKVQQSNKRVRQPEKDVRSNPTLPLPPKKYASFNPTTPMRYSPNISTATNAVTALTNIVAQSTPRPSPVPIPQINSKIIQLPSPCSFPSTFSVSKTRDLTTQSPPSLSNNNDGPYQISGETTRTSSTYHVYKLPATTNRRSRLTSSTTVAPISTQQIFTSIATLVTDQTPTTHTEMAATSRELKSVNNTQRGRGRGRGRGRPRAWRRICKKTEDPTTKIISTDTDSDHDIEIISQSKPQKDHTKGQKLSKVTRRENTGTSKKEGNKNTKITKMKQLKKEGEEVLQDDAVILERESQTGTEEDSHDKSCKGIEENNSTISQNEYNEETIKNIAYDMKQINSRNAGKDLNENNMIMIDDIEDTKSENECNHRNQKESFPVNLNDNCQDSSHSMEIDHPKNVYEEQVDVSSETQQHLPETIPTTSCIIMDSPSSTVFDEKAASETLLMLSRPSSEVVVRQDLEMESHPTTTAPTIPKNNKPGPLFPRLCPCESSTRLPRITVQEYADDQAKFADLSAKVTSLLLILLGETKLVKFGYPTLSVAEVLARVLKLTGTPVAKEDDLCSSSCKLDSEGNPQRTFRLLKARYGVMEINTESLLRVCVPDPDMWDRFGWRGKTIYRIVTDISMYGIPASAQS